ncbi:MAG: hypothetical protein WBE78_19890, partial [Candidatus Binataceae bacterium]
MEEKRAVVPFASSDRRRALRRFELILAIIFMTGTTVVFPAAAETQTTAPLVKAGAGTVRGKIKGGVREFLGIPYAAP